MVDKLPLLSDLIFISTNIHPLLGITKQMVVLICMPPLIGFSLFQHLKDLAFFAFLADVMNFLGLTIVYVSDFSYMTFKTEEEEQIHYTAIWSSMPFFFGVASYCFEGVGMVLPLENSMQHKQHFTPILIATVIIITCIYSTFGICGYLAFGDSTKDVITMNFDNPQSNVATLVKIFVCTALFFIHPLMLFPVFEVLESMFVIPKEEKQQRLQGKLVRASIVLMTGIFAAFIPRMYAFSCDTHSYCSNCMDGWMDGWMDG
jgi:proton-coupled amino acid transporter